VFTIKHRLIILALSATQTEQDRMKIHKRVVIGVKVTAYNDSNVDWVISSVEYGEMRFYRNLFTMAEAIDFYVRLKKTLYA
jgi:hypothetical protein